MLVGRSAESARIDGLLNGVRGGTGGALMLLGEPGIGKSALLQYGSRPRCREAAMTVQPLAPVIPSSAVPAGRQRARAAGGRRLPPVRPELVPSAPKDVAYGIGRIDASGRIADRAVTTALGWRGGDRLTLTADSGVVTARRDPGGMITPPEPRLHRDSRRLAPPLRPAAGRPGTAGRSPRRRHPHRPPARRGGPGHPRLRRVPAGARRKPMTTTPTSPAASQQAAVDAGM